MIKSSLNALDARFHYIHMFGVPGTHCPRMQGLPANKLSTSPELKESPGMENKLPNKALDGAHSHRDLNVDKEALGN